MMPDYAWIIGLILFGVQVAVQSVVAVANCFVALRMASVAAGAQQAVMAEMAK